MDFEKINVSFCNLGYNKKEDRPNYPTLGSNFKVYPFKKLWNIQTQLPKDANKGECGMIFPFDYKVFYGIDKMRDESMLGNGLLFCDLDLHDLSIRDKVWDCLVAANLDEVYTMAKSKHGIHVIGLTNPTTADKYRENALMYLAFLGFIIKSKCGVDLKSIEKALDTHNTNMGQRFFLSWTPEVWWSSKPCLFELAKESKEMLRLEYGDLFLPVVSPTYVKREDYIYESTVNVDIEYLVDKDYPEYIDHTKRWQLFDSICACVEKDDYDSAMMLWQHAVQYMPTFKHSKEFFLNEPIRNKWWQRFQQQPSIYTNDELLRQHGIIIKSKDVRCYTKCNNEKKFEW